MQPVPQDLLKGYVQSQHFTSTTEIMEAIDVYKRQAESSVGLPNGGLRNGLHIILVKGQQLVQITANDLHEVIVANTGAMLTAISRPARQVVANKIPILCAFTLIHLSLIHIS